MNVCEAYPFFWLFYFCWWIRESHWRDCVSAAIEIRKKRERVFEDDVFKIRVLESASKKNAGRNSNADVVLRRSRGSPGHWFPETDYLCASAIFVVGTSGIPLKLNYRSVKSYTLTMPVPAGTSLNFTGAILKIIPLDLMLFFYSDIFQIRFSIAKV